MYIYTYCSVRLPEATGRVPEAPKMLVLHVFELWKGPVMSRPWSGRSPAMARPWPGPGPAMGPLENCLPDRLQIPRFKR